MYIITIWYTRDVLYLYNVYKEKNSKSNDEKNPLGRTPRTIAVGGGPRESRRRGRVRKNERCARVCALRERNDTQKIIFIHRRAGG